MAELPFPMAKVVIENLAKVYPEKEGAGIRAVNALDLTIEDRELLVLVGPSGCGKSTTLRMIAGLEEVTAGTIRIDGRIVNDVPPKDRDIAMVFQNYALYPHMSVRENMAFGLRLRGQAAADIEQRVRDTARILEIEELLDRKPRALSGGQRQRVAVGRAIVRRPKVFLFDEPLSNLDAKMRVTMRTEISKLHARLGATMIYVTHDQMEAMTMGDRICVMKDGKVMQTAAPLELYRRPANMFVAGFIGSPPMNFFHGTIETRAGRLEFVERGHERSPLLRLALGARSAAHVTDRIGAPIVLGIRPEDVHDGLAVIQQPAGATAEVDIEVAEPIGAETHLYLNTGAHPFIARVPGDSRYEIGSRFRAVFNLEHAHLFDPATELALA